ncbi:MAG TPA: peroxiredoxin [Methyloceanibacter sp.]|nr:peroxiredoxin [Methyloceanibacter sp.]
MPAGVGADHVLSGLVLPSIALPSTDGKTISLAELRGRSLLIVYPWTGRPGHANPPRWDDIPGAHGSTPELEGFRDNHADFMRLGLNVFGLSRQTTAYQRELLERLELPFPILSDADGRFSAALGLPSFTTGGTIYLTRLTLLIDNGMIHTVFHPVSNPAGHAAEVLRRLEARR